MTTNKPIQLPDSLIFTSQDLVYEASVVLNDETGKPSLRDNSQPIILNKQMLKNKNRAFQITESYKRCKKIKSCAHLSIGINKYSCYHPICAHQSLNFEGYKLSPYPVGERFDGELLEGCPKICQYYLPNWRKIARDIKTCFWRAILKSVSKLWKMFDSQPPTFKTIIAIIVLAAFAPKIAETVTHILSNK